MDGVGVALLLLAGRCGGCSGDLSRNDPSLFFQCAENPGDDDDDDDDDDDEDMDGSAWTLFDH